MLYQAKDVQSLQVFDFFRTVVIANKILYIVSTSVLTGRSIIKGNNTFELSIIPFDCIVQLCIVNVHKTQ